MSSTHVQSIAFLAVSGIFFQVFRCGIVYLKIIRMQRFGFKRTDLGSELWIFNMGNFIMD